MFVRDEEANERVIDTTNSNLRVRKGNRVAVVYASQPGAKAESPVVVRNLSTRESFEISGGDEAVFPQSAFGCGCLLVLGLIAFIFAELLQKEPSMSGFFVLVWLATILGGLVRYFRTRRPTMKRRFELRKLAGALASAA